ncbi:MAG: hypothetical protein C0598_09960 [Marinilabiliales bacterium]|nr:MAG: hypothetical protein C0598_09960 [Marinilabiliales bacterium]
MIFLVGISIFFMIRIGMVNSTIFSLFFSQKNKTNTTTRIIVIIILIIIPVIFTFLISFIITGIINDSKVHLTILSSFFIIAVFFFYKGKNIKSSKPKVLNITKFDWALSILLLILSLSIYILMLQPISLNA